eukprot:Rhum_TRINITY_DN12340_c1_g2::Rhum_TRINITY_DN12340_c1_g2_i1::g.50849::m.50849
MDVGVRRALAEDIDAVRAIWDAAPETGAHAWREKFPGGVSFRTQVETSFLSVVAVDEAGNVVGFASVNDSPTATAQQREVVQAKSWEKWVAAHFDAAAGLCPANSLWLSAFVAQPAYAEVAAREMLKTVAITLTSVKHLLFACGAAGLFSPLTQVFRRIPDNGSGGEPGMSLYYCHRTDVLPDLLIRKGLVEDFDDLMPLLQAGEGVLTTPPQEFYLDETLENQDESNAVLLAEDPDTRQIIGLLCMEADLDSQTHLTKHYNTEVYNKLRPMADFPRPEGVAAPGPGQPNCFQIRFFFLDPAYTDRAACFLAHAFAQFPSLDYCFVTLPHTTTEHPLVQEFSYVPLKTGLTLPNGVWLLARQALDLLTVSPTCAADTRPLEEMLSAQSELSPENSSKVVQLVHLTTGATGSSAEGASAIAEKEREHVGASDLVCFTLQQNGAAAGFCLARVLTPEDVHHLRGNFLLDDMVCFCPSGNPDYDATVLGPDDLQARHALSAQMPAIDIQFFYVRPAFRCRIRTFLREVLRQTGTQVAVYCLTLHDEASQPLLTELILAKPRRVSEFALAPDEVPPPATEGDELLCLHYMSKKLLSDEKAKIHARLVVVGASTTGLSAIYAWLTIPYLHCSNIVLISRDGIPPHPSSADAENWSVDTLTWLEREYLLFRIAGKLRVVEGTMIEFERTEQYVITDNGFVEPYDHLTITAGRQFSLPRETASRHLAKNGIFELSSISQIHKIKQHIRESEAYEDELSNAVVYGGGLDAFCAVTALTKMGLTPSRIVVVSPEEPAKQDTHSPFRDAAVDHRVDRLLDTIGCKTYKNYTLERTDCDEDHNLASLYIAQVQAKDTASAASPSADDGPRGDAGDEAGGDESTRAGGGGRIDKKKILEIPATMLVYCHEKDIDTQILSALNKRSIVFDGRVIVRANYRTTDPKIYAVGPIAMFSGRFGPSDEFELFNPLEVGQRFAETVLGFLGVEEFYQEDSDELGSAAWQGGGAAGNELKTHAEGGAADGAAAADGATPSPAPGGAAPDAPTDGGGGSGGAAAAAGGERSVPKALPRYTQNVVRRVSLPSDHTYFVCHTAGYDHVAARCRHLSSSQLFDESSGKTSYIRLSIGPHGHVECITYFGSEQVSERCLASLVGMPESLLNIVYEYDRAMTDKGQPTLNLLKYIRSKVCSTPTLPPP